MLRIEFDLLWQVPNADPYRLGSSGSVLIPYGLGEVGAGRYLAPIPHEVSQDGALDSREFDGLLPMRQLS